MSSFREQLLTDVSGLCQKLFKRRLALVQRQQLVSNESKQDIILLITQLNQLRLLDPFPEEATTDLSQLNKLKTDIEAEDGDQFAIQQTLMTWAGGIAPIPEVEAGASPDDATTPINQRMIDNLHLFRSTIDKSRVRLLRDRDRYDRKAYTSARNAFTLARAVYEERLKLNQIDATNEGCARMEQVLIPAVAAATGATFPADIQAGAKFMEDNTFAINTAK